MRRLFGHPLPLRRLGVSGADRDSNFRKWCTGSLGQLRDLIQRGHKIFLDVVGEGLEWGDIHHLRGVWQVALHSLPDQSVNTREERGEGFP